MEESNYDGEDPSSRTNIRGRRLHFMVLAFIGICGLSSVIITLAIAIMTYHVIGDYTGLWVLMGLLSLVFALSFGLLGHVMLLLLPGITREECRGLIKGYAIYYALYSAGFLSIRMGAAALLGWFVCGGLVLLSPILVLRVAVKKMVEEGMLLGTPDGNDYDSLQV